MNKRGITLLYRLCLGMAIIVLAIALATPTKVVIDNPKSDLSCSSPANDFDQGTCWILDIIKFMLVGLLLFAGFAVLITPI